MLHTDSRYATEFKHIDDNYLWDKLSAPYNLPKDQVPQFILATPSGLPGTGMDAVGDIYGLTLDYDGTWDIDEYRAKYKHLMMILFTTSSHTPQRHKFRAIIWLAEPVSQAVLAANKHILLDYFPGHDHCSISTRQSYPNKTSPQSEYLWRSNPGELYDWSMVVEQAKAKGLDTRVPGTKAAVTYNRNCLGQPLGLSRPALYKQQLDDYFTNRLCEIPAYRTGGRRYSLFLGLIIAMREATVGYDMAYSSQQIREFILSHTNDDKRNKMLNSLLKDRP